MTRTGAAAGQRQNFGGGRYWSLRDEVAAHITTFPGAVVEEPEGQAPEVDDEGLSPAPSPDAPAETVSDEREPVGASASA